MDKCLMICSSSSVKTPINALLLAYQDAESEFFGQNFQNEDSYNNQ